MHSVNALSTVASLSDVLVFTSLIFIVFYVTAIWPYYIYLNYYYLKPYVLLSGSKYLYVFYSHTFINSLNRKLIEKCNVPVIVTDTVLHLHRHLCSVTLRIHKPTGL